MASRQPVAVPPPHSARSMSFFGGFPLGPQSSAQLVRLSRPELEDCTSSWGPDYEVEDILCRWLSDTKLEWQLTARIEASPNARAGDDLELPR
jgi:hypothetical protein